MSIFRETMAYLLRQAICDQQAHEQAKGFTRDSSYLATLRNMLAAVERGEQITMET